MITVTVTGSRGEGSTTTAMRIVAYLRSLGFEAGYRSAFKWNWEEFLRHPIVGADPRSFMVCDEGALEPEPSAVGQVVTRLRNMSDEQRKEIFSEFCAFCGNDNPGCNCMRDD